MSNRARKSVKACVLVVPLKELAGMGEHCNDHRPGSCCCWEGPGGVVSCAWSPLRVLCGDIVVI